MAKLLCAAASAFYLLNSAAFAAEKTVTLAIENMTCYRLPANREG